MMPAVEAGKNVHMQSELGSWFGKFGATILIMLAPVKAVMLAIGFLIFIDFVTGIWAALRRGERLTSNGFRRTMVKIVAYQTAIVTGLVLETYLVPEIPFVKIVAAMAGLTEGKSVFENIHSITGMDIWGGFVAKLQGGRNVSKETLIAIGKQPKRKARRRERISRK